MKFAGKVGVLVRIDRKDDPYGLPPIRPLCRCVEQAQIGDEVLLVILRERIAPRGFCCEWLHCYPRSQIADSVPARAFIAVSPIWRNCLQFSEIGDIPIPLRGQVIGAGKVRRFVAI